MSKKRKAHISSGKLPVGDRCPNCLHRLDGVTGVRLDGEFERVGPTGRISVKGTQTICCYCGALLVFADEEGHLRLMTPEERAGRRLDPLLEDLIERVRRERVKPPDFTRKNWN